MIFRILALLLAALATPLLAQDAEWEVYRKTGLFKEGNALWLAPDMAKETVAAFTTRLLNGARTGEPRAMATLGRFFWARGDQARGVEWLRKAAQVGHAGAQLDYGSLFAQGLGVKADIVEAYCWLWLATWAEAPGADDALRTLLPRMESWQIIAGTRLAAIWQRK